MGDVIAVLLTLVLFALGAGYVSALDRLQRAPKATTAATDAIGSTLPGGREVA